MAVSVLVAVGDVGDRLVDAVAARLPKLRIGAGADPGVDLGPLISAEHCGRVVGYVAAGVEAGAVAVVDGRDAELPRSGYFLGATLLDHVTPEMSVYQDEIFGPVLCVVRAETYDEAIALINRNPYANGVAIFTRDGGAARAFAYDVEVGMVGVNVPIPVPVAYYSFGGWKASLFGDQHMYGPEGISFYTRGKVVTTRWPDPADSTIDLGFPRTR
jgi:malonate-semialdehyde dehydrogenase (acetylating)/methylmalonate-semialdehyde dehydrogenase